MSLNNRKQFKTKRRKTMDKKLKMEKSKKKVNKRFKILINLEEQKNEEQN